MNDRNKKQIMETFMRMIDHISNKEYQRRAWIKGEEADFDETVCIFFGGADFILENYKEFGITKSQYELAKKFRDRFQEFSDKVDLPQEFIDTPEWEDIMDKAKEVLEAFNYKKDHGWFLCNQENRR